jgi:hypothetical protein
MVQEVGELLSICLMDSPIYAWCLSDDPMDK